VHSSHSKQSREDKKDNLCYKWSPNVLVIQQPMSYSLNVPYGGGEVDQNTTVLMSPTPSLTVYNTMWMMHLQNLP